MGSFNVQCCVTGMNIADDEPMVIFRVSDRKSSREQDGKIFYVNDLFELTSWPERSTYADYGRFADIEELSPLNKLVDNYLKADLNETEHYMGIHASVYDTMSTGFLEGTYMSDYGTMGTIKEKGIAAFVRGELDAVRDLYLEAIEVSDGDDVRAVARSFLVRMKAENNFQNIVFSLRHSPLVNAIFDHIEQDPVNNLSILGDDLVEQLGKLFYFQYNLSALNLHYKNVNYAGQEDNDREYISFAKMIVKVAEEKEAKREEW